MAPLHVASLGRQWPLASAPFACATVENHISALVREFMLEVQIVFGLRARHDEDQVCHDRLRRIPDVDLLAAGDALKNGRPWRRRALGAVQWEAKGSEDSATRETEGDYDELGANCGHAGALTHALLGDLMGIHS